MVKQPDQLQKTLGLEFCDETLFVTALSHRSVGSANNERLEFLGDSILGFVIAEDLFQRFPDADEGILSRFRASLVNQKTLATIAREYQLGDYLLLGPGELKSGGYRRDSILSDALEAVMGALFKDQGYDASKAWILALFASRLESLSIESWEKDPKTKLQELLQSRKRNLPEYLVVSQSGPPHNQKFEVECVLKELGLKTDGIGGSRKKAEQAAAKEMIESLKTINTNL